MSHPLEPWQTLSSEDVYVSEPWLKLSVEQIRLPDGHIVNGYHRVQMQDYATIFAQVPDSRVIVLRQYKHGVGRVSLMLPGGGIHDSEDPLETAKRELLEETGYTAENWQHLTSFVSSANYRCSHGHIFTACNAQQVAAPNSGDLEEMETVLMTPTDLMTAVKQGEVVVLGAIAAIALALNPLFR